VLGVLLELLLVYLTWVELSEPKFPQYLMLLETELALELVRVMSARPAEWVAESLWETFTDKPLMDEGAVVYKLVVSFHVPVPPNCV